MNMNWISINDRFPDISKEYIVFESGYVRIREWCCVEKCFLHPTKWGTRSIDGITHWMPLPDNPKKKIDTYFLV